MDDYIDNLKSTKSSLNKKISVRNNYTRLQTQALQNLQNNIEIILKETDKRGAIECMNKNVYKNFECPLRILEITTWPLLLGLRLYGMMTLFE